MSFTDFDFPVTPGGSGRSDALTSLPVAARTGASIDLIWEITALAFAGTETNIPGPGNAGFTRQTIVRHVGGGTTDSVDYRIITVVVANPAMANSVRKTTVIAAF